MALFNMMARLGLNTAQFDSGLKRAESGAMKFGKQMKTTLAGVFSVAAVGAIARQFTSLAGSIKDMSDQLGVSRVDVQLLNRQLTDSGLSMEQFRGMMQKVQESREKAVEGNEKLAQSFAVFGVSMSRLKGPQSTLDLIRGMSDGIKSVNMNTENSAKLFSILGNESRRMTEFVKEMNNLPDMVLLTDEEINKLDRAAKLVGHLKEDTKTASASMTVAAGEIVGEIFKAHPLLGARFPIIAKALLKGGFGVDDKDSHEALPLPDRGATKTEDEDEEGGKPGDDKPHLTSPDPKRSFSPMHRDSITSMGGLFTGGDAQLRMIPAQQLTEMKAIREELRDIKAKVEQAAQ